MKKLNNQHRKRNWSARSQRSWLEQYELEDQLAKTQEMVTSCEKKLAELEKGNTSRVANATRGDSYSQLGLGDTLAEIENTKREIVAYKGHAISLKSEIAALVRPSPRRAAERRKRQAVLAKVALERVDNARLLQGALEDVHRLCDERADLTAKMVEAAAAIDLVLDGSVDREEFGVLLASLPPYNVADETQKWADWFLIGKKNQQTKTKRYRIYLTTLTLPETLVSPQVYRAGAAIYLTEKEASRLSQRIIS